MIISLILIGVAFYWLLYETKWLTVRLPYGGTGDMLLQEIVPIVLVAGAIILILKAFLEDEKPKKKKGLYKIPDMEFTETPFEPLQEKEKRVEVKDND